MADVTLADFRAFFPEFQDAEDTMVQLHLDDAASLTLESVFPGSLCAIVTKWRAAASLACSPWGRHARLIDDTGKNVYQVKVDSYIAMAPIGGPWVPGVNPALGLAGLTGVCCPGTPGLGLEPGGVLELEND